MEAGLKTTRSNWAQTVLVCAKCSRKLGGGFGPKGKTALAKAMRQDLGVGKGRKGTLGIVEVKCLKVCPKGAVTVVGGSRPGEWLIVPAGAGTTQVMRELAPPAASGIAGGGLADQGDHVGDALGPVGAELSG